MTGPERIQPDARFAAPVPGRWQRVDWLMLGAIVAFVAISRLLLIPPKVMGGDGPDYINALRLDSTYSVPPPGNVGYVLIAKTLSFVFDDAVIVYAIVATLFSCVAAWGTFALSRLALSRQISTLATLCTLTSVQAWYHGVIMQSYIVWLAAMSCVGYFALRMTLERGGVKTSCVVCASLVIGLFTIVRPDLVVFAGPLFALGMLLGRVRLMHWVIGVVICAACCCFWLFFTAHVLGSLDRYLELVRSKHAWHETYSMSSRGIVEGLGRNVVKYATFMLWSAHAALVLCAMAAFSVLRSWRTNWKWLALAIAWLTPSLYFSWFIFTGNAGLVLPALGLVYVAGAWWLSVKFERTPRVAVVTLTLLAIVNLLQFTLTPLPAPTDQRRVLLTHMFFGYSATGIRRGYTYELPDFGIDKSLKNTAQQMLHPDPTPTIPPGLRVP